MQIRDGERSYTQQRVIIEDQFSQLNVKDTASSNLGGGQQHGLTALDISGSSEMTSKGIMVSHQDLIAFHVFHKS